jgi:hypothetical protein
MTLSRAYMATVAISLCCFETKDKFTNTMIWSNSGNFERALPLPIVIIQVSIPLIMSENVCSGQERFICLMF